MSSNVPMGRLALLTASAYRGAWRTTFCWRWRCSVGALATDTYLRYYLPAGMPGDDPPPDDCGASDG